MENKVRTIEKIEFAIPKKDLKGWESGKKYQVDVQSMWNGRFCIYKQTVHFREPSGYLVYDSLQEIYDDFEVESQVKQI